jgi:hypothetical protein
MTRLIAECSTLRLQRSQRGAIAEFSQSGYVLMQGENLI